jgi:hypothetical protein
LWWLVNVAGAESVVVGAVTLVSMEFIGVGFFCVICAAPVAPAAFKLRF